VNKKKVLIVGLVGIVAVLGIFGKMASDVASASRANAERAIASTMALAPAVNSCGFRNGADAVDFLKAMSAGTGLPPETIASDLCRLCAFPAFRKEIARDGKETMQVFKTIEYLETYVTPEHRQDTIDAVGALSSVGVPGKNGVAMVVVCGKQGVPPGFVALGVTKAAPIVNSSSDRDTALNLAMGFIGLAYDISDDSGLQLQALDLLTNEPYQIELGRRVGEDGAKRLAAMQDPQMWRLTKTRED
jgi:hypothetical protein